MNKTVRILIFSTFIIIATFKIIKGLNEPDSNAEKIDKYFQTNGTMTAARFQNG